MKRHQLILLLLSASLVALAGCGPVRLVANANIPPPLVMKMPIGVALFVPQEFSQYVHQEERWNTDWHIDLGKAQTEGVTRLLNAMFERVAPVDSVNAGTQLAGIRAILEPSIEEYAFVTPRDAGSPFFAVSIKYRVNVYLPDGKLAESWGFTGYGTSPAQGLSSTTPLATATALAMRDAGAKLAVEFREQAIIRGLLPQPESADTSPASASEPPVEEGPGEASGQSAPEEPGAEEASEAPASEAPGPGSGPAESGTESATEPAITESGIEEPPAEQPAAEQPTQPGEEPPPPAPESESQIEPQIEPEGVDALARP